MVCEKANELMMKYMDGLLDDFEEMNLEKHIESCEACSEDFAVYKEMLADFNHNKLEIIEAPDNFAASVMEKIEDINIYFPKKIRDKGKVFDNVIFAVWGTLATVFALGAALYFYQDVLFNWLAENEANGLLTALAPIAAFVTEFGLTLGYYIVAATNVVGDAIRSYSLIFLAALVALVGIQLYISPKFMKKKGRKLM